MYRLPFRRLLGVLGIAAVSAATVTACGGGDSAAGGDDYGLAQPGTITAAVTAGDYPFVSPDASGKPVGMLVDLNNLIADRMHLKIVYKTTTVAAGLPGLTSGQYDMMSVGLVASAERKKSVAFTKAIFWGQNVVVVPANSTVKAIGDLTGKRVGAGANSTQEDFAKKKLSNAQLVSEATDGAGVNQILAGNLDAMVLGSTHVGQIFKEHPGTLKVAITSPQDQPGAEAVNKKLTKFLDAYNKELTDLANDGTFLKLYQKYFPDLPYPTQMYQFWPSIKDQIEKQGAKPTP
ncbi:ABC transporter substrate-binding protein [Amycolatopsis sp. FDAARGOS 1241]|uniref:substrate-binding periplasmic protein n=1 Tax=Amycolatopsis sp. FDAARGOS 1241 TaxID=2778070 RepID=UPI001951633D|nr:ABC transporter substrate-binding protein [Amycolatopsis sp. FDAARGOS 1241]QRP43343.1 amino acid ABC transporter substrate-binding protein [Amycolatopsis sp. FDAARGOS 1241]